MKIEDRLKKLERMLEQLRGGWVFVEGKRDKQALKRLGVRHVFTISGNLQLSCDRLENHVERVFVLTDLDRRGDELAKAARDELEARSIKADTEMRKKLAHFLKIRFFEDAGRAYNEIRKENEGA